MSVFFVSSIYVYICIIEKSKAFIISVHNFIMQINGKHFHHIAIAIAWTKQMQIIIRSGRIWRSDEREMAWHGMHITNTHTVHEYAILFPSILFTLLNNIHIQYRCAELKRGEINQVNPQKQFRDEENPTWIATFLSQSRKGLSSDSDTWHHFYTHFWTSLILKRRAQFEFSSVAFTFIKTMKCPMFVGFIQYTHTA